ncbi:uncharacterized protein DNG_06284 [Cephalotrichum gorgonifer]|uniref:DUF2867 domain-containing protein n=1 Tax=Cephalotrichum gorgonifer TaxID=2041049 RepID=A0AAE8SWB0_9PEZI|nr:uncharacterized protein DNG_06284 [Cephalotrichum gorgonifer]
MPLAPVRAVPYPNESKLRPLYKSAYFVDAFAVPLPSRGSKEYSPDALARALFGAQPAWFSMLMWIRDRVMSVFGVKSSTAIQAEAAKRGIETIYIFPVISRTENEIIMGENDRHLNFQTSLLIREPQLSSAGGGEGIRKGKEVVATTVVHCHGLLGKAYITIIKPFHVMIGRYGLARLPDRIGVKDD